VPSLPVRCYVRRMTEVRRGRKRNSGEGPGPAAAPARGTAAAGAAGGTGGSTTAEPGGSTAAGPAAGTAAGGKVPMRDALAEAAFQLFLERGFEQTTVDDIVARAGVGRRSFFRYFPSKEDAVFPDHERCLDEVRTLLEGDRTPDGAPAGPVAMVCEAARLVTRMYAAKPDFSVQRYRLTREVPGLRHYELSVVHRYERAFAAHLRRRYAALPDGTLRADVIAAAIAAAHNNALRSWLRSGGASDAGPALDRALDLVRRAWEPADGDAPVTAPDPADDEVIVMVARRGTPVWRVVQGIESALENG
jgi:AcrR family transcriptional regulator